MIDQKGHTWILKTLAKHNAKITVLETYFLRNGQIELSFFTDKAGIVRQKIPKETASKSLSELLSEIKKEYKTAQKIRNTGKFACSIVGRNTKLKLDLAGLKEFRHKVQSFPLMHYVQKTKPCNRNEES